MNVKIVSPMPSTATLLPKAAEPYPPLKIVKGRALLEAPELNFAQTSVERARVEYHRNGSSWIRVGGC
jgi:hypothetical protein